MPHEKEINNNLFDQLSIVERIEEAAKKDGAENTLKQCQQERMQIERKLYQKPPLISPENYEKTE